ncbi:MAG TPA: peptidoglycan-binding protein, partial [Campylobacterales bacterium]|nr:peptidoglycan-binding protein [Campylobacterales bacterium]
AQYKTVTKQVVVKPATTKTVTIPAVYKTVKVNKLASEAKTKTINIPATYKTITKTQKVSDAKYTWSNSLAEKPGMTRTNSVICKVSVPAVVKNITKQIVANPSKTKTVTIPATYKTIKVTKIVHPEKTKKIVIPATYKNITKEVLVSPQQVKWMPVLCKSSMTIDTISKIQQALTNAGFETPVTGTLDSATKKSVKEYQAKKGLTISGLTIETIKSLGVF